MSQPTTKERTKSMTHREAEATPRHLQTKANERTAHVNEAISQELRTALNAIPSGSVTARTAGALRVPGRRRTIEDERAFFEQAVAEENARPMEG